MFLHCAGLKKLASSADESGEQSLQCYCLSCDGEGGDFYGIALYGGSSFLPTAGTSFWSLGNATNENFDRYLNFFFFFVGRFSG